MHSLRARATFLFLLLVLSVSTAWNQVRFHSPEPGDVYREYVHNMNGNGDELQVRDPNIQPPFEYLYAPPVPIWIGDLSGAIRAEAVIVFIGGHVSTVGQKMRWNDHEWVDVPLLDGSNGIPAGHPGYNYMMIHDLTMDVPLSWLHEGTNSFQGISGGQADPVWGWGWGQWGWYAMIVRIYYSPDKPHATGTITSVSSGGTLTENPTVAASVSSGSAQRIDFLAYYDDYDTDGDGVYLQYHHDYMLFDGLYSDADVTIRNHVGTATSGPWSVTWNTDWVPDQPAGQVKLLARIKDANDIWYVTPEVNNLSLVRNGTSVKLYKPLDVPECCWVRLDVRNGTEQVHFNIPASDNLANATAARYYVRIWNGGNYGSEKYPEFVDERHFNSWSDVPFGAKHHYTYDVRSMPASALVSGENTWNWYCNINYDHGIEILWPGPALAVRYSGVPSNNPPSISLQPTDQTVAEGQTATFTVAATGSGTLGYRWQKNQSDIGGATTASYTTPTLAVADSGSRYRCVVTNLYGQAISNEVLLSVTHLTAPKITGQPVPHTVADGQPASFTVSVTGSAPLTYRWQKNAVNIPSGADSATYSIAAATLADSGALFRCVVSNAKGADTSSAALLTVTPVSPTITTHPSNIQVGPGDTATFSVVAAGSLPRYYLWEKNGTPVPGATASTYSFAAAKSDSGAAFRCKVTNSGGSVTSNAAYLIVGTFPPVITQHPVQVFARLGQTATFSVTATGTKTLRYHWQSDGADIPEATSASYTTPPVILGDNGRAYRCIVTNDYGADTSDAAMLTVTSDVINLVANGDFESGTDPWSFYSNGSALFSNDSAGPSSAHAAHLRISSPGDNVQLSQVNITLEKDTAYTLLFKAYSSSGNDVDVYLHKNTSPYTSYGLWQTAVDLTSSWKNFRFDFTATGFTGTVSDGRLRFWFVPYNMAGDRYSLDDVLLVKTSALVGPTFTGHPVSRTVNEGETATFSVVVTGTTPFTYQWEKNQVAIPGATSSSYTTPPVSAADDKSQFRCAVTNLVASVTSDPATLSVVTTSVKGKPTLQPTQYYLAQNHPNPFNPSTMIEFGLPVAGHVTLRVSNLLGQEVTTLVDDLMSAGPHQVMFHADGLPSGIYLYRMQSGSFLATKKLILIR